jgi:hypothetical protein
MRKLGWMVLVALASACGDDDKGPKPDAGRSDDAGLSPNGPGCDEQIGVYPGYDGPLVWSEDDLAACEAACPDLQPASCRAEKCPNEQAFFACIDEELYACQTSPGQDCRLEYEQWNCCFFDNCSEVQTDQEFQTCVADNCDAEFSTVEECYFSDTESPGFSRCLNTAYDSCFGTPAPASCDRTMASPEKGYAGERRWTKAWSAQDFKACMDTCKNEPVVSLCMNDECPGAAAYRLCLANETAACTSKTEGDCRGEWEDRFCCVRESCSDVADAAELRTCTASSCGSEADAFTACVDKNLAGSCVAPAEAACAPQDGPDGGADDPDAGADAGPQPPAPSARIKRLPASPEQRAERTARWLNLPSELARQRARLAPGTGGTTR